MGKGLANCQPSTLARGLWEPPWHPGQDSGLQGGPGHPGRPAHSPHSRLEGRVLESRFISSCWSLRRKPWAHSEPLLPALSLQPETIVPYIVYSLFQKTFPGPPKSPSPTPHMPPAALRKPAVNFSQKFLQRRLSGGEKWTPRSFRGISPPSKKKKE